MDLINLIIIGTGPAGGAAAIYASMAGVKNIKIFAGQVPGGQLTTTSIVDNYPGCYGISGNDLAQNLINHIEKYVEIVYEFVDDVEEKDGYLVVKTNMGEYNTKYLIIASGSSPKKLQAKNIISLENKGVSYCHVCDGFLFRNKPVAVVGGGNSAFEAVIYLSSICSKVYLIHRSEKFRALNELQEKVKILVDQKKVEIIYNSEVVEGFSENDVLHELLLTSGRKIQVDGLFIHIGHNPQTKFIRKAGVLIDNEGYIIVDRNQKSSNFRIYACGDCCVFNDGFKKYKQAVSAASEGLHAALTISEIIF